MGLELNWVHQSSMWYFNSAIWLLEAAPAVQAAPSVVDLIKAVCGVV